MFIERMEGVTVEEGEEFRQINDYPNYWISNLGRCWNNKTQKFVGADNGHGYIIVSLCNGRADKQMFKVHRLVMQYFGPPMPEEMNEVDHINTNRTDNRIQNLRWVTRSQNQKNKTGRIHKYTFIDNLPESAESLDSYGAHDLDGVYVDYESQKLYLFNGIRYRELVPCRVRGNIHYNVCDIENKEVTLAHKILFG